MILPIVLGSAILSFIQEYNASSAAEKLQIDDDFMKDRNIDVLYHEVGDSVMIFRLSLWISTCSD